MSLHRDIENYGVQLILDMLLAHRAMGRDLDEIISYLARVRKRQMTEEKEP